MGVRGEARDADGDQQRPCRNVGQRRGEEPEHRLQGDRQRRRQDPAEPREPGRVDREVRDGHAVPRGEDIATGRGAEAKDDGQQDRQRHVEARARLDHQARAFATG